MIFSELPKRIDGNRLASLVESSMGELEGFNIEREPIYHYGPDSEPVEVRRLLIARKKLKWYDPITAARESSVLLPKEFVYLVPGFGQGLYAVMLSDKEVRRCVIKTRIDLNREHGVLGFRVGRGHFPDIGYKHPIYGKVKEDVEKFLSILNEKIANVDMQ